MGSSMYVSLTLCLRVCVFGDACVRGLRGRVLFGDRIVDHDLDACCASLSFFC